MNKLLMAFIMVTIMAAPTIAKSENIQKAIVAGGCFWCVESDFEKLGGVVSAVSGYTGGSLKNPSYHSVSGGGSGHYEAVEISFDQDKISYGEIIDYFLRHIDPLDDGGQFCDRGEQYKTAVFYLYDAQKKAAELSKQKAENELGSKIATMIVPAGEFYRAEEYHQDYYLKNATQYKFYRWNCGRDKKINQIWKK